MKFSSRRNRDAVEVSMIPLVDLFLNILIFFLVATSFSQENAFFVQLPKAESSEGLSKAKQVFVSMGAKGDLSINNQKISKAELKSKLEETSAELRKTMPVFVRADTSVLHGDVVEVLDTIRLVGFQNVGMATAAKSP